MRNRLLTPNEFKSRIAEQLINPYEFIELKKITNTMLCQAAVLELNEQLENEHIEVGEINNGEYRQLVSFMLHDDMEHLLLPLSVFNEKFIRPCVKGLVDIVKGKSKKIKTVKINFGDSIKQNTQTLDCTSLTYLEEYCIVNMGLVKQLRIGVIYPS